MIYRDQSLDLLEQWIEEGVEDLSLTTNGHLLASFAGALREAGLRRVTVSLDSLDEQVFKSMSGRRFTTVSVLAGIDAADRAASSTAAKIALALALASPGTPLISVPLLLRPIFSESYTAP